MNQKIWDYIKYNGGFDQKYKGKEPAGNNRFPTFKAAISLFLQRNSFNVLETGCQRAKDDFGAGCSSLIFAETLKEFPDKGLLYSIDISYDNLRICHECIKHTGETFKLLHGDSVKILSETSGAIGLLYLDSMDYEIYQQKESQIHQLNEIKAIYDKLNDDTIILLDDNMFENGGKTLLTKDFLIKENWKCLLDCDQTLWAKNI